MQARSMSARPRARRAPRILLGLLLLLLPEVAARASDPSQWKVATIHDGDTFEVIIPDLPPKLQRVGIRVRGVDAPEMAGRAKCMTERVMANQARDFTVAFLGYGTLQLEDLAWDKYGGRIDARVMVDGKDLAQALIVAGLGHQFNGEGKRAGWCDGPK
jgi:micrococcal nuclease